MFLLMIWRISIHLSNYYIVWPTSYICLMNPVTQARSNLSSLHINYINESVLLYLFAVFIHPNVFPQPGHQPSILCPLVTLSLSSINILNSTKLTSKGRSWRSYFNLYSMGKLIVFMIHFKIFSFIINNINQYNIIYSYLIFTTFSLLDFKLFSSQLSFLMIFSTLIRLGSQIILLLNFTYLLDYCPQLICFYASNFCLFAIISEPNFFGCTFQKQHFYLFFQQKFDKQLLNVELFSFIELCAILLNFYTYLGTWATRNFYYLFMILIFYTNSNFRFFIFDKLMLTVQEQLLR